MNRPSKKLYKMKLKDKQGFVRKLNVDYNYCIINMAYID